MAAKIDTAKRFDRLTTLCLAFPYTTREDKGEHANFLVGKKTFAYYLHNHHGDGLTSVSCKTLPGDHVRLVRADPQRFYFPAYIGPRGWVALRLDLAAVDWNEVNELLLGSYVIVAPQKLSKLP